MILISVMLLWLFIIFYFARKGHYFFILLIFFIGLYEIGGQLYLRYLTENIGGVNVHKIINERIFDFNMLNYDFFLFVFFLSTALLYFFINSRYYKIRNEITSNNNLIGNFNFLLFGIFILGITAISTDAGSISRLDYLDEVYNNEIVNPSLPYGQLLLVCASSLLLHSLVNHKWFYFLFICLLISPITYELYIAGRRQAFFPSLLLIVLLILYRRDIKYKYYILYTIAIIFIVFTSFQFNARASDEAFNISVFLNQFIEIPLIHATSLISFSISDIDQISYGSHYIIAIMNSFPYFHLGDFLLKLFDINPWRYDPAIVSPLGGLSMLGDSILAFYLLGPFIFSFLIATLSSYFHNFFLYCSKSNNFIAPKAMLVLPLGTLFIMYYRNGFSHLIKTSISFCFIYFFFVYLPCILFSLLKFKCTTKEI